MGRVVGLVRRQNSLFVAAPLLSIAVVLAGLAIGFAWRLLLSPLAADDPGRVVVLRKSEGSSAPARFNTADYERLNTSGAFVLFESTAAFGSRTLTVDAGPGPTRVSVGFVTPDFFQVIGRPVAHGRGFEVDDFADAAVPVAVLSDRYWQNDLNGVDDVLGRRITVGALDVTVIGIAPPGVVGTNLATAPAAFLPLPQVVTAAANVRVTVNPIDGGPAPWLEILGRVAPTDSLPNVARELHVEQELSFVPLRDVVVPFTSRVELVGAMRLFLIAALTFLLLGATTFAMVALLHLESRRAEWAIRLALGAHRWQIAARASADVLLMTILAVAFALPMTGLAMQVFRGVLLPGGIVAQSVGLTLDGPSVLFAALAGMLAASLVTGIVGLTIAAHLRVGGRIDQPLPGTLALSERLRGAVVAVLLSLMVVLLGGAVFATRTVSRTLAVDLGGQRPDRVLHARYDLAEYEYTDLAAEDFVGGLMARAVSSPAVNKGSVHYLVGWSDAVYLDGQMQVYPGVFPERVVGPSYLQVLGLKVLAGRDFGEGDRLSEPPVVVVSESVADTIAEGNGFADRRELVGRSLRTRLGTSATIVGIVQNWVYNPRDLTGRAIYLLAAQHPVRNPWASYWTQPTFVFDVNDAEEAKRAVRAANAALDSRIAPVSLDTPEDAVRSVYALQDLASRTMTVFSTVAVILAFVSLHVLVRSIVSTRRKEVAIRTALGARASGIARWLLGRIARPVLVAIVAGALGLWVWFSVMSVQIVGLTTDDLGPVLLILGIALLSAIGATVGPAVWASRHLPSRWLRED